jgi:hypothetical protein
VLVVLLAVKLVATLVRSARRARFDRGAGAARAVGVVLCCPDLPDNFKLFFILPLRLAPISFQTLHIPNACST